MRWGRRSSGLAADRHPLAPRGRRRAYLQRNHAHHTDAGGIRESDVEVNISIEAARYILKTPSRKSIWISVKGPSQASSEMQDVMLVATRKGECGYSGSRSQKCGFGSGDRGYRGLCLGKLIPSADGGFAQDWRRRAAQPDKPREGLVALIDIGATITNLYILQQDRVIFTREQGFGCDQLTLRIAETYGLSREQAEQAKRSADPVAEDFATAVHEPFKHMLAEQIGHGLQFFFPPTNMLRAAIM